MERARELSRTLFPLLNLPDFAPENKSVSSVYVSMLWLFFCRVLWVYSGAKVGIFQTKTQKRKIFFRGRAFFCGNVVILQAVGRGNGVKNELIIKT